MKYLFLASLFIISINFQSFSQNFEKYFELQNKAELLIINSQYDSAVRVYQKAFLEHKKPFAKDLYNYSISCILTNNQNEAINSLKKLKKIGFPNEEICKIKKINGASKFFEQIDSLELLPIEINNFPLRDSLYQLRVRDQFFRKKTGSYKVYGDTIRKIDKENDAKLRLFFSQYGFPDEYEIGVSPNLNPTQAFDIVIWHQTQMNFIYDYTEILENAVKNGKLDPHRASELIDNQQGDSRYVSEILYKISCKDCSQEFKTKIDKKLYYFDIKKSVQINEKRKKLFLESIDDYRKKVIFDTKKNDFKFFYKGAVPNLIFDTEKDVINGIETMKFINE